MGEAERLGPDAEFEKRLKAGKFCIQRCEDTGRHVFYPRQLSPYSGSDRLTWVEASGKGTVYSTTTIRQKPERGGDYNLSIIALAEGPKLMSRVEGVPPDAVKIGMEVYARIAEADGTSLVVFDAVVS
jgi:uncharacterized OB-fold protein